MATVELGGTVSRGMMVIDQRVGTLRVSFVLIAHSNVFGERFKTPHIPDVGY